MASAGAIRAGKAYVEASLDATKLKKGLGQVQDRLKKFSANIGAVGKSFLALGAAIVVPLAAAVKQFSAAGDQLDKMSKRTGFAVETLSALDFAASQSGASLDQLDKALAAMARFSLMASRGLATATDVLDELGLSIEDVTGGTGEEKFLKLASKISEIEDPTLKAGMALQVFGRQGRELLPMLSGGEEGIEALMERARELGIVMTEEDATAAAQFTDQMDELMRSAKFLGTTIARELMPSAMNFSKFVTEVIPSVREWLEENGEMILLLAKVGAGLLVAGVGLIALAALLSAAATVAGVAKAAVDLLNISLASTARAGAVAFAITGILLFAREVYKANQAVQDLNNNLEKSSELDSQLNSKTAGKNAGVLEKAGTLSGSGKTEFLSSELEMAEKNLAGMNSSLNGQKKLLNDLSPTWRSLWQSGKAEFDVEKQELDAINGRLKTQKKFVNDLRKAQAEAAKNENQELVRTTEELSGIDSVLGGLNEQLETFGMDAGEKAVRKLETLNANEAELAEAREKLAELSLKEAEAADAKKKEEADKKAEENADKVADILNDLWMEMAETDLSAIEKTIAEQRRSLEELGATPEQLAMAEAITRQMDGEISTGEKASDNGALEVGTQAALSAYLKATSGGSPEEETAANTARMADLQKQMVKLQKKEMLANHDKVIIGRPG